MKENGVGQWKFGWRFFGDELRFHREQLGLSQQELGTMVYCTGSYIGQIENAMRRPQPELAKQLDVALRTNGLFTRMCARLENNSPYDDYFATAAEMEGRATMICEYGGQIIPGLFQTESYARALFRAVQPLLPAAEVDTLIESRMIRSKIYTDSELTTRPLLWPIIDESAVHRVVGGPQVMAEQLDRLVQLAEDAIILLQVVPYSAGAHALQEGRLKLMCFSDEPPVAYLEGPFSGELIDDPIMVAKLDMSYSLLRARAMAFDDSLALVKSVAKGLRR